MRDPFLSRRGLLKGAVAIGGAAVGSRIAGPFVTPAIAAAEPSHFVHIFLNGGLNALFAGNADKFAAAGLFDTTTSNIKKVGNGVFTDASTLGTLGDTALAHWAALGMKHGAASHTTPQNVNGGGERAILMDGTDCVLNKLAASMGGDSAFKAVHFGDRLPAYKEQPAFQGVTIQHITSLSDAFKALGGGPASTNGANANANADPTAGRGDSAVGLGAALAMGKNPIAMNPTRLGPLNDAYGSAISSLKKAPMTTVSASDIDKAYNLGGSTTVSSFASMLAGAELMVRGAGSNVVNVTDTGLASWDFHQTSGGKSQNGFFSRRRFLGEGGFKENRMAAIKTFIDRMLAVQGRNIVVAISGELVRLPSGDHGDGVVAAVFGKNIKQGVSFGVDAKSQFAKDAPPPKGFWAAIAAACNVNGSPFGDNPHSALVG